MKLKDEIAEMEAQLAAFTSMVNDPRTSEQDRAIWQARLDEVLLAQLVLAEDMANDPMGYLAWRVADDNELEQRRVRKLPQ